MWRLLFIPLGLVALLALAMGWSGEDDPRPPDFVFINRGEVNTLDPNAMTWLQDIRVGYALWEGLYTYHPETLEAIPGAAEHVEISEDGRVYTFHLRPNGRWHSGDPVVAGDFVFGWKRMLSHPGYYTYLLNYIEGAAQFQEAIAQWSQAYLEAGERGDPEAQEELLADQPSFAAMVGVEALDDLTLRVRLVSPVPFFPDLCAFPPFFPLHEASMKPFAELGSDGKIRYRAEFTRAGNLVGNGPYRLDSWQFKRRLRLVASEHYWDRDNVRSGIIDMLSFEDPQAAFLKYESGGVHWLSAVDAEIAPELLAAGRADLRVFPGFGTYYLTINCGERLADGRPNPMHDVRVRQALAMAIDKRPIVETITRLGQPVATTFIPPDAFADYEPVRGFPFDPEQARALLAEAGYPGGRGFPQTSLLILAEPDRHIAQNVRSQWALQLGITVNIESLEVGTFRHRVRNREHMIARATWIGDYMDPSTFTDKYLSTSDNNLTGWGSAEYDRLCREATMETDPARRMKLLHQAEQIFIEEAPIIPIYHFVNVYMFRDNVRGIPLHPRNMVMFKAVELLPETAAAE